jgi:YcxB-like protein
MLKPDPATRVARYETSADEFADVMVLLGRSIYGPQGKSVAWSTLRYFLVGVLIYIAIFLVFGVVAEQQGWYTLGDFMVVFTTAAIAALVVLKAVQFLQLRRLRKLLRSTQWDKSVEVFANHQGLAWGTTDQQHFIAWDGIRRVLPHQEGYVFVSGILGAPVPGRAFTSPEARQQFDDLIAKHLPEGVMP